MDYQYKSVYDGLNQNEILNSNLNLNIGKNKNNKNIFSNEITNNSTNLNSYNFDYNNKNIRLTIV